MRGGLSNHISFFVHSRTPTHLHIYTPPHNPERLTALESASAISEPP